MANLFRVVLDVNGGKVDGIIVSPDVINAILEKTPSTSVLLAMDDAAFIKVMYDNVTILGTLLACVTGQGTVDSVDAFKELGDDYRGDDVSQRFKAIADRVSAPKLILPS